MAENQNIGKFVYFCCLAMLVLLRKCCLRNFWPSSSEDSSRKFSVQLSDYRLLILLNCIHAARIYRFFKWIKMGANQHWWWITVDAAVWAPVPRHPFECQKGWPLGTYPFWHFCPLRPVSLVSFLLCPIVRDRPCEYRCVSLAQFAGEVIGEFC